MINYNIRILHEATSVLNDLIATHQLIPVNESLEGVKGQVYALVDAVPSVQNHFELQAAGRVIQANLYALPPEEYAGLLASSPIFTQYQLNHLIAPLSAPMEAQAKEEWLTQLVSCLRAEAVTDNTPHLLLNQVVNAAHWCPARTRFFKLEVGWFVALFFESPKVQVTHGVQRSAVGIDVGLNTLAVTAYRTGLVQRTAGITDICPTPELLFKLCGHDQQLQTSVKRHVLLLQHAAARLEFNQIVRTLLSSASVVYTEDLKYKEVNDAFKRRSRELGIRDFLMTWLPKRLTAQGIPWQRVNPDRTSQYCHLTHQKGERDCHDRTKFRNGNGDIVDADLNAALNIMQLGFAYRVERGL